MNMCTQIVQIVQIGPHMLSLLARLGNDTLGILPSPGSDVGWAVAHSWAQPHSSSCVGWAGAHFWVLPRSVSDVGWAVTHS